MFSADAFKLQLRMLGLQSPHQMAAMQIAGRFSGNDQNLIRI